MTSQPRHHTIPAAFIGRFSATETGRRRKRPIWTAAAPDRVHPDSPSDVCWERGFYSSSAETVLGDLDSAWTSVEQRLAPALRAVVQGGECSAHEWLVLVKFITDMLVRTPSFVESFTSGLRNLLGERHDEIVPDERANSRFAMVTHAQRQAWPVMAAEWTLLENASDVPLITSDVGYAGLSKPNGETGYVIPIDPHRALAVTTGPHYLTLAWHNGWFVEGIQRAELDAHMVRGLVRAMAQSARNSVFGPTRHSVDWLLPDLTTPRGLLRTDLLWRGNLAWLRDNEMTLFRVITIISQEQPPGVGFFRLR